MPQFISILRHVHFDEVLGVERQRLTGYWRGRLCERLIHPAPNSLPSTANPQCLPSSFLLPYLLHLYKHSCQYGLTRSKSLLGIFLACSFLRNSCPNFWRLANPNSAASSVPPRSSALLPCRAMLKLNPGDGSAAVKAFQLMTFKRISRIITSQTSSC